MDIIKKLSGLSKIRAFAISFLLVALILLLDYYNGKDISVRILYLIPITITTWNVGLAGGILISLVSALSKIFIDFITGTTYSNLVLWGWEGFVVFGIFSTYVFILYKLKKVLFDLEETNKKLKDASELKIELLGIASHDLKNPLSNIYSYATIINEDKEITRDEVDKISARIIDISKQMFKIIDNIISSSAMEMEELKIKKEKIDLVEVISCMIKQYSISANKKSLVINFEKESEHIFAYTDAELVLQVMDNLVSNAIKFTPPQKNIFIKIKNITGSGHKVRIEVVDEGPGISNSDRQKLFSRFTKLTAKPTGGESSTGLGLYSAKKFTDAIGGRIWCENEPGKGAKFIVELN